MDSVDCGDVTVVVGGQNGGWLYGKTIDADGSEYLWRAFQGELMWFADPGYYIRTKTEAAVETV